MTYTTSTELKETLTSILETYDLPQSQIDQLLSAEFINEAFELIQNEPENDEFMNFARNFSEEQNLVSIATAQQKIAKELNTKGYVTDVFQYVIDAWRDIDFSSASLLRMNSNNSDEDNITIEDVNKTKIIADMAMGILKFPAPVREMTNIVLDYTKMAIATYNQDKKFYDIAETFDRQMRELASNLRPLFSTAETTRSPLIVDLDGDGVETTSVTGGVYFDHDGNGFAENSSWVGKDDDILVYFVNDRNLSLTKYTQES